MGDRPRRGVSDAVLTRRPAVTRSAAWLDPVTRGWAVITAGSVARLAIGFVASVIIARALGPARFGSYALLGATAGLAGAVSEFGLTQAAVRRIGRDWPRRPADAAAQAAAFVWLRVLSSAVVVALLIACLPLAARRLPSGDPRLLAYALLGVVAVALSGSVSGVLQATSRFRALSLVMVCNALLTVILAAGLRLLGWLNLTTALLVLGVATSLACFLVGRRLLPPGIGLAWPGRPALRRDARELCRVGSWVWVANSLALVAARLDLFLAGYWLSPAAVGGYVLAVNLAGKADVVNQSLYAALLPSAAALDTPESVRRYLRGGMLRSGAVALAFLPLFPLARPLIPLVFGSGYLAAVAPFAGLLLIALFDLFTAPALLLCYSADAPQLLAAADGTRVVTLAAAALWLVPGYGVAGLILAKFLARLAGAALTLAYLVSRRQDLLGGIGRLGLRREG